MSLLGIVYRIYVRSVGGRSLSRVVGRHYRGICSVIGPVLRRRGRIRCLVGIAKGRQSSLVFLRGSSGGLSMSGRRTIVHRLSVVTSSVVVAGGGLARRGGHGARSLALSVVKVVLAVLFSLLSLLSTRGFSTLRVCVSCVGWVLSVACVCIICYAAVVGGPLTRLVWISGCRWGIMCVTSF